MSELSIDTARSTVSGDSGDRAEMFDGETDLDGDGAEDLVIGAFYRTGPGKTWGTGRAAVLLDLPDGEHRVWDIASATFTPTVIGAEFGLTVRSGDLDGDGLGEALIGAPLSYDDGAYVYTGPFDDGRDRADTEADWIVRGSEPEANAWVGYGLAVGDVDGDGAPDLAVGMPESVYSGTNPGRVALFLAPVPGAYTDADADVVLTSGVDAPDAFGMAMDAGDLDGDGLIDLVIGAPRDPTNGDYAGSVTLVYGASL